MRRSERRPGASRLFWSIAIMAALAALLAPAASATPGDQLWTKLWPTPAIDYYEIRSDPVLVRGPGGDLWIAATGMDGMDRDRNYVVLRYAPTGAARWTFETGASPFGSDYAADIAVARDGSAYVTGTTTGRGIWTIKVSPAGKRIWARRLGTSFANGAVGFAVACDSHANAYVLGTLDRSGKGRELVLVAYSPRGKLRWTRYLSAPGGGNDIGVDVVVDAKGRCFIAGTVASLHKGTEVALARFTTAGALVWKRIWDGGASKDDVAHALAVSKAGVAVAGATMPATGNAQGVVLKAKLSMTKAAKLRALRSAVPGLDLGWASVATNGAGEVAATGEATSGGTSEFAVAKWLATGAVATFTHYTPLSGAASGHRVWLTSGGTVVAAGWLSTALGSGMHLVSLGPAPHAWVRTTVDVGVCTGLVVSADGVCVAGTVGPGSLPPQIGLWMYEP